MANSDRAQVRNAADPQQVRAAGRRDHDRAGRQLDVLRAVMATPSGREYLANLLEGAGLYEPVYDHSGSTMYFKEGRRNFGLEQLALMIAADEDLYELLERERRARRRAEDRRTDAAHTPAADSGSKQ